MKIRITHTDVVDLGRGKAITIEVPAQQALIASRLVIEPPRGLRPTEAHCPKCDTTKNVAGFHRDSSRSTGRCSWCKECKNADTLARNVARNHEAQTARRATRRLFADLRDEVTTT